MHNTELRTQGPRLIAVGRNDRFPRLSDTYAGLRWAGPAARTVAALEAVERGAERECA